VTTPLRVLPIVLALAASALAACSLAGCDDLGSLKLCGEIPGGGCPAGRGGSCDDALCSGLYDCVDGDWSLVESCDGGATTGGVTSSTSSSSGAGGCEPVALDHSQEVTGCTPDLESPDCPSQAAEVCGPCLTGCVDFFICEADGWQDVAYCTDDGTLVVTQGGR